MYKWLYSNIIFLILLVNKKLQYNSIKKENSLPCALKPNLAISYTNLPSPAPGINIFIPFS